MKTPANQESKSITLPDARYACYLPLAVLILGQIVAFLDRATQNQQPLPAYWFLLDIWSGALFAAPIIGIVWGVFAWKRHSGKLAIVLNLVFLVYAMTYPHHSALGF